MTTLPWVVEHSVTIERCGLYLSTPYEQVELRVAYRIMYVQTNVLAPDMIFLSSGSQHFSVF
jgi:hypothetical protein